MFILIEKRPQHLKSICNIGGSHLATDYQAKTPLGDRQIVVTQTVSLRLRCK
jgi:hypothetical protein